MSRVMLACHQFFPRFYTGTEILTLEIAEELRRRGNDVAIITVEPILPGDSVPNEITIETMKYNEFPIYKLYIPNPHDQIERLVRESDDVKLQSSFRTILEEWKPDVVHSFHLMRLTASFAKIVKEMLIPFYITITDFWLLCPTYQLIRYDDTLCSGPSGNGCFACLSDAYSKGMPRVPIKFKLAKKLPWLATMVNKTAGECKSILTNRTVIHKKLFDLIDGVIWSNKFIQQIFHDNGMRNDNEFILPFPIPERAKGLIGLPLAKSEEVLKVAFIGTLRKSKGPQVLIEASKHFPANVKIELHIWGAAEKEEYYNELVELAANDNRIQFRGTFPQEKFPEVLEDIHVVVLPSLWYENTPLTALSAQAAKRILVVSDLGGLSSLVDNGVNGYTFKAGDSEELSSILVKIANNRELLNKLTENIQVPNQVEHYVDNLIDIWN
ncbi:glycosyltransferase [Paenibacillus piri]|uniref:Glycosyltransferase n=1 Tax=Paenibacillus piri TaxID=2547395 RepID=A0A4R5KNG8_9BACL|nr:glycosyltransferase [Paenibacillus piri]TDF96207.1 glycosyltransferase [Paenibacillus piri]